MKPLVAAFLLCWTVSVAEVLRVVDGDTFDVNVAVWPAPLTGEPIGWIARRFRPLVERKTDISIFKKMLVPKRATEDA